MLSRATTTTTLSAATLFVVVLALRFLRSDEPLPVPVVTAPQPTADVSHNRESPHGGDVTVVSAAANVLAEAPLRDVLPKTRVVPTWKADAFETPPPSGMQNVDDAFAAEAVDPLWAPNREAEVLGEIARTPGLQVSTIQVECRTTACRVQIVQRVPTLDQASAFVPDPGYYELFDRLGYQGSSAIPKGGYSRRRREGDLGGLPRASERC